MQKHCTKREQSGFETVSMSVIRAYSQRISIVSIFYLSLEYTVMRFQQLQSRQAQTSNLTMVSYLKK